MTNVEFRPQSLAFWAAAGATLALFGSLAFAQPTLPLPTPGTAPAAPAAPAGVPSDVAAKARAAALAAKANVDVTEAWAKASGTATSAPIYLHIVSVKEPDRLLSVDAAMANHVELHDDSPQATARVIPMPVIDIPGGATVNLGPGGRYLTLVGLKAPLKEGDSFLITLKFDKAGTSSTSVKILGAAATGLPSTSAARRGDTTAGVSQR
ncbi:MAG TPA: copper chaperone PCu(A)C [Micropepsaceae bacterium]|jgi:copper(I)-binding protein|nr:copper chaperone PCu(A)C [Micropepsaceae bacterium]